MIRLNIPQSSRPRKKKPSSKRFYLVYLWGGVEVSIVGKAHKTYDLLLAAAQKMFKEGIRDGQDNLFYLVTYAKKPPEMGEFTSDELEPDEAPDEGH